MPPQLERVFAHETAWIREYAKTYLPNEAGFSYSPDDLFRAGTSIIGIRNVLRRGYVVFANKLDCPGARWVIDGENNDGESFRLTLTVITESIAVSLQKVERVVRLEKREDGNDAA